MYQKTTAQVEPMLSGLIAELIEIRPFEEMDIAV